MSSSTISVVEMPAVLSRREVLRRAQGLALATPFLGLVACDAGGRASLNLAGATMGTTYRVTIPDPPAGLDRRALESGIERDLEAVNGQMSNWRAGSEVSRFNDRASPCLARHAHRRRGGARGRPPVGRRLRPDDRAPGRSLGVRAGLGRAARPARAPDRSRAPEDRISACPHPGVGAGRGQGPARRPRTQSNREQLSNQPMPRQGHR